jgi:hypothetical protein
MPDGLDVGYFLEDIAQRDFVVALVERIAADTGLLVSHQVRNATGGKGRAVTELEHYLRDVRAGREPGCPILVVVIDGNCVSYHGKRQEIEQAAQRTRYAGTLVCGVPNPHIERWYLADGEGFRSAVAGSQPPALPAYKCERRRYKHALRQAFDAAGIRPQLGGVEYAADIVARMDLYRAGRTDAAFKHFIDDLRAALRQMARL